MQIKRPINYCHKFGYAKQFQHKIVNIFLSISFYIGFGCSKNYLIKTILLSTDPVFFVCFYEKSEYTLSTDKPNALMRDYLQY